MQPDIPGESKDHPHHRGLWFTHGDVNGYDFWGNEPEQKGAGKGKGEVVLKKVNKVSSGKTGTIDATFEWKAGGQTLLTESRKMTFSSEPHARIIDFDITLSPDEKVTFGDTGTDPFGSGTYASRSAVVGSNGSPLSNDWRVSVAAQM